MNHESVCPHLPASLIRSAATPPVYQGRRPAAISHFIGAIGFAWAGIPLLIKAGQSGQPLALLAMTVYSLSLVALYSASAAYHTIPASHPQETLLKKIDHMMIFVMIAGSYTPVCLLALAKVFGADPAGGDLGLHHPGGLLDAVLCVLPQMGVLGAVYRHGLGLHLCPAPAAGLPVPGLLRLAAGRRPAVHPPAG